MTTTYDVAASESEDCQACPTPKVQSSTENPNTLPPPSGGTNPPPPTPDKKLVAAPTARGPGCAQVAQNEVVVPGEPPEPEVPDALCSTIKWESEWGEGKDYKAETVSHDVTTKDIPAVEADPEADPPVPASPAVPSGPTDPESKADIKCTSVVRKDGYAYICLKSHKSTIQNQPVSPTSVYDYKGAWAPGEVYKTYSSTTPKSSVVSYSGKKFYCIQDHISEQENVPVDPDISSSGTGTQYWAVVDDSAASVGEGAEFWELWSGASTATGGGSMTPADKTTLDYLKQLTDDVLDWVENADLLDWLALGAAAAGVIWAGSALLDALEPDVTQPEDQNASYNGSPGYSGTATAPSLQDVVTSLCVYAGINYDTSALGSDPCEFTIASNTQIRSLLEQLAAAYQFDMVDSGGILKFVPRNTTVRATITLADMGFSSSSDIPTPYTAKRYQGITLPRSVSLTYISPDIDYNQYTQKSEITTFEEGQDVNISVPIVLDHAKARAICETTIINAHLERMNYKFNTSYKYMFLEPGDCVNTPFGLARISKVEEVEEGILEFEVTDAGDDAAIVGSGLDIQLPTPSNNVIKPVVQSGVIFVDPNNLDDQDKSVRIYAAVHGFGDSNWGGAVVFKSDDNGATYTQCGEANVPATLGVVSTAMPYTSTFVWDEVTEVTVTLTSGSLISKSEIAVLNGENWAQIGQEIIGFCTATLIAPNTYKISKLLRGRQGTDVYAALHQPDELFCMLDNLVRIEFTDAERGTKKLFKVVSIGASLSSATPQLVEIISNNTRLWSVFDVTHYIDADNVKISWKERVRFDNALKDYADINHDNDWGGFGIAVTDNNGLLKSTHVTTSSTFTYTTAMQTSDWGGLHQNCRFQIMPMSTKFGAGYPTTINT